MTLIKSISGIRGTIGGNPGQNLTPVDIVESISAYGSWLKTNHLNQKIKVVVGRDARISGEMVENICIGTLQAMGINVVNIGLSTTPTVEIAVPLENADGGIILTASHNPKQWNALKLLNNKGEFISAEDGKQLLSFIEKNQFSFASVEELGIVTFNDNYIDEHINKVLELNHVDINAIKEAELSVVIDAVNSTGGIVIPKLLKALKCKEITEIYCTPNGEFPHNPEPLAEHLEDLSNKVKEKNADLGIVVDPDVDRLAFVCENGEVFGEEYTLVAVADHITGEKPGNSVSNLSSTRALATYFANKKLKMSDLKSSFPQYTISKNKLALTKSTNIDLLLEKISNNYKNVKQNKIDGLKLEFENEWVHMRKSNTEPIIRIYAESQNEKSAHNLGERFVEELKSLI